MPHRASPLRMTHEAIRDQRRPSLAKPTLNDYLDEQEVESFPASDPHSDWAGPPIDSMPVSTKPTQGLPITTAD